MHADDTIEDRLFAIIPDDNGRHERLGPAVRTAAQRLKGLTPIVMQASRHGISAGPVAADFRDRVPVVLAEGDRCVTCFCLVETTIENLFDELIKAAEEMKALAVKRDLGPPPAWLAVRAMVEAYGAEPGAKAPKEPPAWNSMAVVGLCLLETPDRAWLAETVTKIRQDGVCPALVCVIGPALSGDPNRASFGWPLVVAMGRYDLEAQSGHPLRRQQR